MKFAKDVVITPRHRLKMCAMCIPSVDQKKAYAMLSKPFFSIRDPVYNYNYQGYLTEHMHLVVALLAFD